MTQPIRPYFIRAQSRLVEPMNCSAAGGGYTRRLLADFAGGNATGAKPGRPGRGHHYSPGIGCMGNFWGCRAADAAAGATFLAKSGLLAAGIRGGIAGSRGGNWDRCWTDHMVWRGSPLASWSGDGSAALAIETGPPRIFGDHGAAYKADTAIQARDHIGMGAHGTDGSIGPPAAPN